MACGCADKLNSRREQLDNNKILNIDSMQQLSIDQIVNLYKQGYSIDTGSDLQTNLQTSPIIESMVYVDNCPGPANTDRFNNNSGSSNPYEPGLYINNIEAQRFVPTSRCLDSVVLRIKRVTSDTSLGVIVDIVQDDGSGNPNISASFASYTIPGSTIPTANYSNITININVVLNNLNPLWIIARSSIYDGTYRGPQPLLFLLNGGTFSTNDLIEYAASYIPSGVINIWIKNLSQKLYYFTNAQIYIPTPVLTTITITPPSASINVNTTVQLTATCRDQNNAIMTCPSLTWTSNNTTKATVNSSGLVTGVSAGNADIKANVGPITSNASVITVISLTPVLTTITISPASQSINTGGIVQLTAICRDQNNAIMTCPTLTWASSNTPKATVSSNGLVTGASIGSANITASVGTITSNTSVITVTGTVSTLTSIVVTPTSSSIIVGGNVQLTATCKDQNNATMTCPALIWTSSDPTKATVNPSGLATGVSEGTSNVTASSGITTSNTSLMTVSTTLPQAGGGGGIVVIAAVAIAAALMMSKK